ncbi:MAG: asparagine synthase (glutamine-hydrolyzing), partial [Ruminococcus sp.]|nr:asparagine synthase (glutamine-hydrolyzing) [Ruminococcus sp.]
MCGIVGFANNINDSNRVLDECLLKIKHRGPDSDGKYIDDGVALGFRRLSIIDLKSGHQPIFNEDNSKILLFNGEIYNYRLLREDLLKCGHKFRTKADSEVLLHGYEEFGTDLLTKLRGMFAFVIWDKNKKELFGARDFFGIKPFYYYHTDRDFIFGSEIKSFLPHPNFNKMLNEKALENYLTFQYSVTNDTFFQRVYKLPPAHYFIYKDNKLEINRYWNISFSEFNSKSFDEWVDSIEKTFKNSVSAHKISDVEVGCFLSSGIDSSYVAAAADVDKTFTVGFGKDKKYNEISYAEEFSQFIKKENISKNITPEEYWAVLPKIQYHMDEPLADPSAVALYFVSKLASERVKVVLSGEGADEIFAGYNVYSEPNSGLYDKLPYKFRNKVSKIASKFPGGRGVNFLVRKGLPVEERFIGNAYIFSESERKKILKIDTSAKSPAEITEPFFD